MHKKSKFTLLFIIICFKFSLAQSDTSNVTNFNSTALQSHFSLLTGIGIQHSLLIDIGIAMNEFGRVGYHPFSEGFYISNELIFGSELIFGPKIGVYLAGGAGGMALGINLIGYTDFSSHTIHIRPEIGFGILNFKFTYGYNIRLVKSDPYNINRHNFSLVIFFSLKKLDNKYIEY
ncbi:MAG: hypothetical protein D6813_09345 [Calditrichaeota bacterium]|nr:MAG: hypothetical protein D6813_09345 [Calditrichota bacterium]